MPERNGTGGATDRAIVLYIISIEIYALEWVTTVLSVNMPCDWDCTFIIFYLVFLIKSACD